MYWNPQNNVEWKWRTKARTSKMISAETSGTIEDVARFANDRILAVMTGRFFAVNESSYCTAEDYGYESDADEWAPERRSATSNDCFAADVTRYRLDHTSPGSDGHPYTNLYDLEFTYFSSSDVTCRYNRFVCEYRVYGYGNRGNVVVWWTPDGEVRMDSRMKLVMVMECCAIEASPLKFAFGTVDASICANGQTNLNQREFWSTFLLYGYFGSIGVDKYDQDLEALRLSLQQTTYYPQGKKKTGGEGAGENKIIRSCCWCGDRPLELLKCSRCKARYFCSKRCQKKDWTSSHKTVCTTTTDTTSAAR